MRMMASGKYIENNPKNESTTPVTMGTNWLAARSESACAREAQKTQTTQVETQ